MSARATTTSRSTRARCMTIWVAISVSTSRSRAPSKWKTSEQMTASKRKNNISVHTTNLCIVGDGLELSWKERFLASPNHCKEASLVTVEESSDRVDSSLMLLVMELSCHYFLPLLLMMCLRV
ncbi:hypothetical protein C4D60_Mb04t39650 [Musa balbisiana]|uniref:Uncharacterized protein n=1 Tax=Musa balbisiana TaxID=52838 RepID=A0A4S8KI65_MUSBA|nr:hypothetical protein C4D60_Mb04t39650 [Musa balbisiana]